MDGTQTIALRVTPPRIMRVEFTLVGTAPLVISRFSEKAMNEMMGRQAAGSTAKKGRARVARDFDANFQGARHISSEGWDGIHAGAFRNAMISACRLVGFKMTLAKLSLFIEADGFDRVDGVPLVRIIGPEPERLDMPARNANGGTDIRTRPMWREWSIKLRVRYDSEQFTAEDVANLISRVGAQVGIGEGRADSRASAGVGWGHFEVAAS